MISKTLVTGAWRLCRCKFYWRRHGFVPSLESCSYPVDTVHAKAGWAAFKAPCILGVWLNKHIATITAQFIDGLYGPSPSLRALQQEIKNALGVKRRYILSMHTRWFVFPGGRPHISLYVLDGNLVFALVPGGLCSGSLGRCCQVSSSRSGSRRAFCVFKSKVWSCCRSHLQNVSVKEWKGYPGSR